MTRPVVELTARDIDTGESDTVLIGDGPAGYVVTCGPGCEVTSEQRYGNGTVQITIKPTATREGDGA